MEQKKYDIFISYRREGGFELAKLLCVELRRRGYRVFLDVDNLQPGPFDSHLYTFIDDCKDFLVILDKNALAPREDRSDDWLCNEASRAINGKKNIVPIMMKGFEFPKPMPYYMVNLRPLARCHGISVPEAEWFNAMVERLCREFLTSRPVVKKVVVETNPETENTAEPTFSNEVSELEARKATEEAEKAKEWDRFLEEPRQSRFSISSIIAAILLIGILSDACWCFVDPGAWTKHENFGKGVYALFVNVPPAPDPDDKNQDDQDPKPDITKIAKEQRAEIAKLETSVQEVESTRNQLSNTCETLNRIFKDRSLSSYNITNINVDISAAKAQLQRISDECNRLSKEEPARLGNLLVGEINLSITQKVEAAINTAKSDLQKIPPQFDEIQKLLTDAKKLMIEQIALKTERAIELDNLNTAGKCINVIKEIDENSPEIQRLETKSKTTPLYKKADTARNVRDWNNVLLNVEKILEIDPNHDNAKELKLIAEANQEVEQLLKEISTTVEEAESKVQISSWEESKKLWSEVEKKADQALQWRTNGKVDVVGKFQEMLNKCAQTKTNAMIGILAGDAYLAIKAATSSGTGLNKEKLDLARQKVNEIYKLDSDNKDAETISYQIENMVYSASAYKLDSDMDYIWRVFCKENILNEYRDTEIRGVLSIGKTNYVKDRMLFISKRVRKLNDENSYWKKRDLEECFEWGKMLLNKKTFKNEKEQKKFEADLEKEYEKWKAAEEKKKEKQ